MSLVGLWCRPPQRHAPKPQSSTPRLRSLISESNANPKSQVLNLGPKEEFVFVRCVDGALVCFCGWDLFNIIKDRTEGASAVSGVGAWISRFRLHGRR